MSLVSLLYLAFKLSVSVRAADSASAPVVDLGYAQYQGIVDTDLNITAFLGMRYAAPPTGNLRWQAPTAPSRISGVQEATSNPPQCYQGTFGASPTNPLAPRDETPVQTEDCLFLSVYSPALNTTELLPTIVWIHGGGYAFGSASGYNGSDLVEESNREIVVVTIQYRLGLFGFLAGQEVKDGGVLNAGLLDQDFALRWVHKNIDKFGGDPDRVTIWGESAGAGSVLQHVVAHNGRTEPQLFRAAITSSTFLPSQYSHNHSIPQTLFNQVASQAGCNTTDFLNCLRAVDGASLQDINLSMILAGFFGTFTFVPVIDGSFITQSPTEALAQGKVNGKILLSVTNSNEGVVFVNQTLEYNVPEFVRELFPLFGVNQSQAVATIYESLGSPLAQVNAIMGESIFICPTYNLLNAFPEDAYKGEYAIPPALHGDDIFYYFPSYTFPGASLSFNNSAFIDAFTQGFLSFAVHLNPNQKLRASITPAWSTWAPRDTEMVFNRTEGNEPSIAAAPTLDTLLSRCEFWKSVRNLTAQ
ncbi:Alpha/Beta hydrolase protein [Mycena maculata]|uniref:Carboxylic ester hydrolase n=1 Tax=Mycena maculata TaxID=230809 RepID=A0AAD7NZT6_9AGAR|nr:Alpha/Beta hydrolase protein [Mycena maculata]